MCPNWTKLEDSRACVEALFDAINSQFHFKDDGGIFGTDFHLQDDCIAALEPFIDLYREIPQEMKHNILSSAVWKAGQQKNLNYNSFMPFLKDSQGEYLRKSKQNYTFVSSISVKFFKELNSKRKNLPIKFSARLPKENKFKDYIAGFAGNLPFKEIPDDYTILQIPVSARNEFEAFHSAIRMIDYLRSIWNWKYEPQRRIFPATLGGYPMNFFTLGPIHIILKPNLAFSETIFYETEFKHRSTDISKEWTELKKFEQKSRRAISNHPYGSEIADAMCKLVQALDYPDSHTAFLRLWQVLEHITGTERAKYQNLIDKVVFIQTEPINLHRAFLQNLRQQRNSSIHVGKRSEKIENHLISLKGYVKSVFSYHINNPFKVKRMKDAISYLEMSTDKSFIKTQLEKYKKVQDFLR